MSVPVNQPDSSEALGDLIGGTAAATMLRRRFLPKKLVRHLHTGSALDEVTSLISDRRALYPNLYDSDEALKRDLELYDVELAPTKRGKKNDYAEVLPKPPSEKGSNVIGQKEETPLSLQEEKCRQCTVACGDNVKNTLPVSDNLHLNREILPKNAQFTATANNSMSSLVQPSNSSSESGIAFRTTDIWGRRPAKEPPQLIECSVCLGQVNGLRFASHLDKCLGIGTMSRNSSSQRKQQQT